MDGSHATVRSGSVGDIDGSSPRAAVGRSLLGSIGISAMQGIGSVDSDGSRQQYR